MVKYKKAFKEMLEDNQNIFNDFKKIHDDFGKNTINSQKKFNSQGTKVLHIIRRYENNLCSHSEKSGFGIFSANLSDKFWGEVRNYLPLIDQVKIS